MACGGDGGGSNYTWNTESELCSLPPNALMPPRFLRFRRATDLLSAPGHSANRRLDGETGGVELGLKNGLAILVAA